jgi:multiple sugar transport system ATP-binding protein
VAIGRAIVRAPKVFLFDEPLSNLDAALRGQTRVEIANLHRDLGATTIYVTHDQIEAMTLADRVVVLRDGMIEQVGSPLELYDHPANQFVAQFIGTPQMNVLAAAALPELTRIAGARLPADGSVGVRPEYVRVVPAGQGIAGKVELVESLGSDTLIHTRVGANVPLVSRQGERTSLKLGDAVGIEIDPNALLFFDNQGRALRAMQQAA